jgi:hypothetical protein
MKEEVGLQITGKVLDALDPYEFTNSAGFRVTCRSVLIELIGTAGACKMGCYLYNGRINQLEIGDVFKAVLQCKSVISTQGPYFNPQLSLTRIEILEEHHD